MGQAAAGVHHLRDMLIIQLHQPSSQQRTAAVHRLCAQPCTVSDFSGN